MKFFAFGLLPLAAAQSANDIIQGILSGGPNLSNSTFVVSDLDTRLNVEEFDVEANKTRLDFDIEVEDLTHNLRSGVGTPHANITYVKSGYYPDQVLFLDNDKDRQVNSFAIGSDSAAQNKEGQAVFVFYNDDGGAVGTYYAAEYNKGSDFRKNETHFNAQDDFVVNNVLTEAVVYDHDGHRMASVGLGGNPIFEVLRDTKAVKISPGQIEAGGVKEGNLLGVVEFAPLNTTASQEVVSNNTATVENGSINLKREKEVQKTLDFHPKGLLDVNVDSFSRIPILIEAEDIDALESLANKQEDIATKLAVLKVLDALFELATLDHPFLGNP